MKRNPKIHWRWFKRFHETRKLDASNGLMYIGPGKEDDPLVIQIAEAENGILQIWKLLSEDQFVWMVSAYHKREWGFSMSQQNAALHATKTFKRICAAHDDS